MTRILGIFLFLLVGLGFPLSPSEEKQLIKDIAEIKATLKTFMEQTDKRLEQIDKRIDELRQDMNAKFEQVNKQFEQLYTFLWIITGIFTTLTISVIGFAWWDRRSIFKYMSLNEEIFQKFIKFLLGNLNEHEKEIIVSRKRFEKSILQPYLWSFLKKEIKGYCVVKEYQYKETGREAIDIAVLSPPSRMEIAIELKGLPFKAEGSKANDLRNHIVEVGKDIINLYQLKKEGKIQEAFSIVCLYHSEEKLEANDIDIEGEDIWKLGLLIAIICEVIKEISKEKQCKGISTAWFLQKVKELREKQFEEIPDYIQENIGSIVTGEVGINKEYFFKTLKDKITIYSNIKIETKEYPVQKINEGSFLHFFQFKLLSP